MSTCKLREFSSVEKQKSQDLGAFHMSVRPSNERKNVVLQLHGKKEDAESVDTAFFACLTPKDAAKLYCKIGDVLWGLDFPIKEFEQKWIDRSNEKTENPEPTPEKD